TGEKGRWPVLEIGGRMALPALEESAPPRHAAEQMPFILVMPANLAALPSPANVLRREDIPTQGGGGADRPAILGSGHPQSAERRGIGRHRRNGLRNDLKELEDAVGLFRRHSSPPIGQGRAPREDGSARHRT